MSCMAFRSPDMSSLSVHSQLLIARMSRSVSTRGTSSCIQPAFACTSSPDSTLPFSFLTPFFTARCLLWVWYTAYIAVRRNVLSKLEKAVFQDKMVRHSCPAAAGLRCRHRATPAPSLLTFPSCSQIANRELTAPSAGCFTSCRPSPTPLSASLCGSQTQFGLRFSPAGDRGPAMRLSSCPP